MRRDILLGATKEGTIVFADVEIRERNGERIFSASFDEVRPVEVTNEYLEERAENFIDSVDKEYLYDMCERFDCKPSELVDELVGECNYLGIESLIDISLYSECFSVEGCTDDVYFESDGCGQHDTREYLIPINKEFSEWLHSLWDTYHLSNLTDEEVNNVVRRIREYEEEVGNNEEWIQEWLEEEWS